MEDGGQAWEALSGEDPPRLAILDWMMPEFTGVEVCERVRAERHEPYIYLILLTSRTRPEDLVEGMEAGADDFLGKPVSGRELQVRVRAGARIVELQAALVEAREALRDQATRDALTKTLNRGAILEALESAIARCTRTGESLGLLMADLDRFKSINDTLGHQAGDAVLRSISARMTEHMRPYDAVGRYGGEEFLLLVPDAGRAETLLVAERLRREVAQTVVPWEDEPIEVTVSIGATCFEGREAVEPDELVRQADEALYRAKADGRNRVKLYRPS